MERDFADERRLAHEQLRAAELAFNRTVADCRERIRAKAEWLREARRRLAAAEGRLAQTTAVGDKPSGAGGDRD